MLIMLDFSCLIVELIFSHKFKIWRKIKKCLDLDFMILEYIWVY